MNSRIARSNRSCLVNRLALWAGLAVSVGVGGAALGQAAGAAPAKEPATPSTTLLVVEHTGLANLLVDPKDQALKRALAMLPARVNELPREIHEMPAEAAGYINMALSTLARPTRFAATYTNGAPTGGFFNYGLMLSLGAEGEQDAQKLHGMVQMLMKEAEVPVRFKPSTRYATMLEGPVAGVGSLAYGPRAGEGGAWRYDVQFGTVGEPDAVVSTLPKVSGATAWLRGRLDLSGLTPAVKMLKGAAKNEPEAIEMIEKARDYGLYGADGVKASFSIGHTDTHSVSKLMIEDAARHADHWYLNKETLSERDFKAVPSDATSAMLMKADFNWLQDLINLGKAHEPDFIDALEQFHEHTGVELQNDLIANIGGTIGFYTSTSTGGGGLLSGVALLSFKNRDAFVAAHDKLVAHAHALIDEHLPLGPGYIRVTPWKDGATQLFSLRFNGLPVPLEITYAPLKDFLVVALTPQAAVVGARQALGQGDGGLASNELFTASIPTMKGLGAVSFSDPRRSIADGYGVLTLLGSAISNAVRSPRDPTREPGMIVPTYAELVKGAKPTVSWTYWDGANYVMEARGDRSVLVQMAAASGSFLGSIGGMVPAMLPALEKMDIDGLVRGEAWTPAMTGDLAGSLERWLPWSPQRVLDAAMAAR